MSFNGIANVLMLTNPVKKILLPLAQQRLSLPLTVPNHDYKYILKPQPFWCSNKCNSLMKCYKINNSNTKCMKDGSLINSIQSSTYNVFKITYPLKISNYSYIELNSAIDVIGTAYYKENLEKYNQEIEIILYSLKDMKLQNEYGFFLKTHEKMIFFKNSSMDLNMVYTNIKLIDLDKMKNN
jgi:hypothetical protein